MMMAEGAMAAKWVKAEAIRGGAWEKETLETEGTLGRPRPHSPLSPKAPLSPPSDRKAPAELAGAVRRRRAPVWGLAA